MAYRRTGATAATVTAAVAAVTATALIFILRAARDSLPRSQQLLLQLPHSVAVTVDMAIHDAGVDVVAVHVQQGTVADSHKEEAVGRHKHRLRFSSVAKNILIRLQNKVNELGDQLVEAVVRVVDKGAVEGLGEPIVKLTHREDQHLAKGGPHSRAHEIIDKATTIDQVPEYQVHLAVFRAFRKDLRQGRGSGVDPVVPPLWWFC